MSKRFPRIVLAVGLALALVAPAGRAEEPTNLTLRKQELAAYTNSGEYAKRVGSVALRANKYLAKRVAKGAKPGKKLAIVFDIDETVLTNLGHIIANDYGYVPKIWDQWVAEAQAPAIVPVQTVYDMALRSEIAIFFITGRKESDRAATEKNLREVGYEKWTEIYFKPAVTEQPLTTAGFKTETRRRLTREGYVIVANIGDQYSDLANGYAERTFKLPNPYYLVR